MKPESKPKIIIPKDVFDKVMHWCKKAAPNEVSGFGVVEQLEPGTFKVKDAILLEQENTSGDTELNAAAIADAEFDYLNQGGLRWWWHSHVNMDVFWSGTDMAAMRQLGGQGWILATVFNLKHQHRSAMYVKCRTDFGELNQFIDELETDIITYYPQETFDKWDEEFKSKVKDKPKANTLYQYPDSGWYGGGSWRDKQKQDDWNQYLSRTYGESNRSLIDGVSVPQFQMLPKDYRGSTVMVGRSLYEWSANEHRYVFDSLASDWGL